jgi:alpha-L-fucosidase 2
MNALVADNGFHLNGDFKHTGLTAWHNRPFTMESHFSFCDGIHLMLMQEHEGYLSLCPALPDGWDDVEFVKLRSYGGLLVSLKLDGGEITKLTLTAPRTMTVKIKDVRGLSKLMGTDSENGFITLSLNRGTVKFGGK